MQYLPGQPQDPDELRLELLRRSAHRELAAIYSSVLGVGLIVALQWTRAPAALLAAFVALRFASLLHNHWLARRLLRVQTLHQAGRLPLRLLAGVSFAGVSWGLPVWMVADFPFDGRDLVMVVLPLVATVLMLITAAYWGQSMVVFIAPMWLTIGARLAQESWTTAWPLFAGIAVLLAVVTIYGRQLHRQSCEGVAAELLSRRLSEDLQRANARLEAALQHAMNLATRDPLTGLLNRRAMVERIDAEGARLARQAQSAAVLLLDLDHFKLVNDAHGHAVGDEVLRQCARQMLTALRQEDLMARWGGEEFLAVLPGADRATALQAAQRMRAAVAATRLPSAPGLRPTASIGWAIWSPPQSIDAAIAEADTGLYRAKSGGRDRVEPAT
ncbi:GGDEF domain-containing protein [Ideonella sp. 4Y16]|uniref:diguanylate cyclase n=1 Tax=Ideonella alba TaxID=2824118 RepID=A0A941BFT0_9BURK|nr:GGDEF domain-containing protein [Ideonella alba]MBQ0929748.1 GGDEF domain-containing protein [Ideonella alba]MBQ0941988.1 GGDEF domain-containing protein [Ideonella alba]